MKINESEMENKNRPFFTSLITCKTLSKQNYSETKHVSGLQIKINIKRRVVKFKFF